MFKCPDGATIRISDATIRISEQYGGRVWLDLPLGESNLVNVVQVSVEIEALKKAIHEYEVEKRNRTAAHA